MLPPTLCSAAGPAGLHLYHTALSGPSDLQLRQAGEGFHAVPGEFYLNLPLWLYELISFTSTLLMFSG